MSETQNPSGYTPSEEIIETIQSSTGLSRDVILGMPERRIAWLLQKLEVPNRPLARIEYERDTLLNDNQVIPEESYTRAQAQLSQMRAAMPSAFRSVAGVPTGNTLFSTAARALARTAGLDTSSTGWTALGPGRVGGRTRTLVIDPTNPDRLYAGGVGGGVWRTIDGGATWYPTDDFMANLAICSLVMDPTDPSTLYAGTGEGYANVDAIRGDGIFKTTNGGATWESLPITRANDDFFYVNSMAISSDGQTLIAATINGIFRSTDSGENWTKCFHAGMGNVVFDPSDDTKAIAGGLSGNGTTQGKAYYSTDGGQTWLQATTPTANGRVQVCYAIADSTTVYASVQASPSALWRSTDGGATYTARDATWSGRDANFLAGQGWYDNVLWAGDPTDSELVLVGGVDLWRSTDGGNTLKPISTWWSDESAHADHHVIVSDPGYDGIDNRRVYFGNDGGVYRTDNVTTVGNNANEPYTNGWVNLNNGYAVTQFYYGDGHIATNTLVGGAQDNGTLRYTPAQGPNGWNELWGGDGGDVASDPSDPQTWYGEYVYLQIFRDTSGGFSASLENDYICGRYWDGRRWVWKPAPFTIPDAQSEQAQFIAPFELDPNDPNRLLGGGLSLWRTDNAKRPNRISPPDGPRWISIKEPIGTSRRNHSITAIAIAHGNSDIVVVGHANGDIYRSTDATAATPTWEQIDTNGINANRHCLALTIDPDNHEILYATFGGFQADNLWRSLDGGTSWQKISNDLPETPMRDITVHPQRSEWLYLATDVGVFASEDGGEHWSPTNEGPANVACRDFFWLGSRLICVTHGRGMFEIDLVIVDAYPAPNLAFIGTETYTVQGSTFTRYLLSITNYETYPNSLFRPSPDLPPCGTNRNAARTWVDIYSGDTNQRIYGFCAFDSADDLTQLWFALPEGDPPPSTVYAVLRDRRCNATYTSNKAAIAVGTFGLTLWSHQWLFGYTIIRLQLENEQGESLSPADQATVQLTMARGEQNPQTVGLMRWHQSWHSFYYYLQNAAAGSKLTATAFVDGIEVGQAEIVL